MTMSGCAIGRFRGMSGNSVSIWRMRDLSMPTSDGLLRIRCLMASCFLRLPLSYVSTLTLDVVMAHFYLNIMCHEFVEIRCRGRDFHSAQPHSAELRRFEPRSSPFLVEKDQVSPSKGQHDWPDYTTAASSRLSRGLFLILSA